ncbi:ribonuclease H-like domain-containing protein, partial [Mycena pura]
PRMPVVSPSVVPPPLESEFDEWLQSLFSDIMDEEQLMEFTYGTRFHSATRTKQVYVDGSCIGQGTNHAAAGAGIYWGPGHPANKGVRVPGEQTNNRAELYAILVALSSSGTDVPLAIWTDSLYAIDTIVHQGPHLAQTGWKCANGDVLRAIQYRIRLRPAAVQFHHVRGHSNNLSNDAADSLAKEG